MELEVNSELLKKLSQVGYMACMKGFATDGEIIMEGVRQIRPQQVPVLMGIAIAKISTMDYVEAARIIKEDILTQDPENVTAKCFLGVALFEMGEQQQARHYFNEVINKGNQDHIAICKVYLTE